jgi:hypothetical protein
MNRAEKYRLLYKKREKDASILHPSPCEAVD